MIILNPLKIKSNIVNKSQNCEFFLKEYENILNFGYLSCPYCYSSQYIRYGFYERNVIFIQNNSLCSKVLKIQRIQCKNCKKTHGLLPDGLNFPELKYYETYAYATVDEQYQRRILGDATGEAGPFNISQLRQISSWYNEDAHFNVFDIPWFVRGANSLHGLGAGVFAFSSEYGRADGYLTYRVVLM